MKVCPICGSTYEATVDFCFKDGAPLDVTGGAGAASELPYPSDLSVDDLEPPDAISLSNIPALDHDEDAIATQTLPTDLVDAEARLRVADKARAGRLRQGGVDEADFILSLKAEEANKVM